MATNHTENYQLNLWEPEDAVLREEFNENFQKIDTGIAAALQTAKDDLASSAAATLKHQFFVHEPTYEMTLTLTFDFKPMVVIFFSLGGSDYTAGFMFRGQTNGLPMRHKSLNDLYALTWGENSLTIKPDHSVSGFATYDGIFNGKTFGVLALG